MRRSSFLILLASFSLFSCHQSSTSTSEFGTVDSLAIAADTTMQLGIESSYEYHKTVAAADTVAFDIVGYGGSASQGELAVLRRGANNKADTVLKQRREGMISDVALKGGELTITLRHPKDTVAVQVIKYNMATGK